MKIIKSDEGVSEIVGTLLLLSIVVGVFGIVYMNIFNYELPDMQPSTHISVTTHEQKIIIEHQRGSDLFIDSMVIINLNGNRLDFTIGDLLKSQDKADNRFSIGEIAIYNTGVDLSTQSVRVFIIDKTTSFSYDSGEIL
jgi:hypothetical protein